MCKVRSVFSEAPPLPCVFVLYFFNFVLDVFLYPGNYP